MSKHWVEIFAAPGTLVRSYLAAEVTTKCLQKTVITDFHLQQTTRWAQWHPRDQTPVRKMPLKGLEAASLGQKIMASYKEFVSGESHYFWSWYLQESPKLLCPMFRADLLWRFWKFLYCLSPCRTAPWNQWGRSWSHPWGTVHCVEILVQ